MTDEQYKKLPQYARSEIHRLRGDVDELRRKLPTSWTLEETNTFIGYYGVEGGLGVALPNNARIVFKIGKRASIDCAVRDGKLHIMGSHHGPLVVYPQVTNVVDLIVEELSYPQTMIKDK